MDRKASPTFQGLKGFMNFMRCRLLRLALGEDLDAEEEALVAAGLMRLPIKEKSDNFLALPAPQVAMADIQAVIRAERDED
jgi:hypothetical protein